MLHFFADFWGNKVIIIEPSVVTIAIRDNFYVHRIVFGERQGQKTIIVTASMETGTMVSNGRSVVFQATPATKRHMLGLNRFPNQKHKWYGTL